MLDRRVQEQSARFQDAHTQCCLTCAVLAEARGYALSQYRGMPDRTSWFRLEVDHRRGRRTSNATFHVLRVWLRLRAT
eukprot:3719980-Pyramimonas_sp.AAC.1